ESGSTLLAEHRLPGRGILQVVGFLAARANGLDRHRARLSLWERNGVISNNARIYRTRQLMDNTNLRIDCQSHLFCPEILDRMERRESDPLVYRRAGERFVRMEDWHPKVLPNHTDVQA